jgi:hypothetical protein
MTGGDAVEFEQLPLTAGREFSQHVKQAPERGSKVLQEGSTSLQTPSKYCRDPQAWP